MPPERGYRAASSASVSAPKQRDDGADDPEQRDRADGADFRRDRARNAEDAAADGGADQHRDRAEQAQPARQPFRRRARHNFRFCIGDRFHGPRA